jgi:hypothetical protein
VRIFMTSSSVGGLARPSRCSVRDVSKVAAREVPGIERDGRSS